MYLDIKNDGDTMTQQPLITIVMATLNCEETLNKSLSSIVGQSYKNIELVIVDGQSTDKTLQIINDFKSKVSYFETSADTGIYHAWNKALKHVSGDWVIFIGADDYFINHSVVESMVKHLLGLQHMDLVYGSALLGDETSHVKRGAEWSWRKFRRKMVGIPHTATFHNKSMFDRVASFDEGFQLAGDYDFLLKFGQNLKAVFIDEPIVCLGINGITKTQHLKAIKENRTAQKKNKVASDGLIEIWYYYARFYLLVRDTLLK